MSNTSFRRLFRLALLLSRDPYVGTSEHVRAAVAFCRSRPGRPASSPRARTSRFGEADRSNRGGSFNREALGPSGSRHLLNMFLTSRSIDDTRLEQGEGSRQGRPRVIRP